jgi:hypothetical protein
MARNVICSWTERFALVLEDLRALPREPPIVAEGAGLFPALVAPLVARPQQAIWLVPTAAFCATMRRRRRSAMPAQTSDPERAWCNLIAGLHDEARWVEIVPSRITCQGINR